MGFYNVQNGDAPYFKKLADDYSMSDNFHQSVDGGTGANHIMLGHGDMIWFSDGKRQSCDASAQSDRSGGNLANAGTVDEVENPNAAANTNNWYSEDGYGGGSFGAPSFGGGSYTNCADTTQPGVCLNDPQLSEVAPDAGQSALRGRSLLSAEQLQPRLLRQRQQRLYRHQSG